MTHVSRTSAPVSGPKRARSGSDRHAPITNNSVSRPVRDNDDDDCRDMNYVDRVRLVLLASPRRMLTLAQIYQAFRERWGSEFDNTNRAWQNSVRHALSMETSFQQQSREPGEGGQSAGKGKWWRLCETNPSNRSLTTSTRLLTRPRTQASTSSTSSGPLPSPTSLVLSSVLGVPGVPGVLGVPDGPGPILPAPSTTTTPLSPSSTHHFYPPLTLASTPTQTQTPTHTQAQLQLPISRPSLPPPTSSTIPPSIFFPHPPLSPSHLQLPPIHVPGALWPEHNLAHPTHGSAPRRPEPEVLQVPSQDMWAG